MNDSQEFGAIVVRPGVDLSVPVAPGDDVVTYLLGERYPYTDLPPHRGCTMDLVRYQDAVMRYTNSENSWAVRDKLRCDCYRVVAQVLVHLPSDRLWVSMRPERVPAEFRGGAGRATDEIVYAMHGVDGEAPHVGGVVSCNGCDKRWLVVSFAEQAELFRIASATHGAKIVP